MAAPRRIRPSLDTSSFLLRRVAYRDADWIVTLFTEARGRVSALARGARRSRRRFAGSLEPVHTLRVTLSEPSRGDLYTLQEADIERPRIHLVKNLDALECAGRVLGWVRQGSPAGESDRGIWNVLNRCLDRLNESATTDPVRNVLAEIGFEILTALGWGYEFERCLSCGRAAPEGRAAQLSALRGGLICQACGGAELTLPGAQRSRLVATSRGEAGILTSVDISTALNLVDKAMQMHAGID